MKNWLLLILALLLAAISLYLNRDWFAKENIQIVHRSRPLTQGFFRKKKAFPAGDPAAQTDPVLFSFGRSLKLKSLQVFPVSDIETNKYPHPIWHLITESNSVPLRSFVYGMNLKGMHPAVPGATPDPLVPGVKYRLAIEAGTQKAEHDFIPNQRTP